MSDNDLLKTLEELKNKREKVGEKVKYLTAKVEILKHALTNAVAATDIKQNSGGIEDQQNGQGKTKEGLEHALNSFIKWVETNGSPENESDEHSKQQLLNSLKVALSWAKTATHEEEDEIMKNLMKESIMSAMKWVDNSEVLKRNDEDFRKQLRESLCCLLRGLSDFALKDTDDDAIRRALQGYIRTAFEWKEPERKEKTDQDELEFPIEEEGALGQNEKQPEEELIGLSEENYTDVDNDYVNKFENAEETESKESKKDEFDYVSANEITEETQGLEGDGAEVNIGRSYPSVKELKEELNMYVNKNADNAEETEENEPTTENFEIADDRPAERKKITDNLSLKGDDKTDTEIKIGTSYHPAQESTEDTGELSRSSYTGEDSKKIDEIKDEQPLKEYLEKPIDHKKEIGNVVENVIGHEDSADVNLSPCCTTNKEVKNENAEKLSHSLTEVFNTVNNLIVKQDDAYMQNELLNMLIIAIHLAAKITSKPEDDIIKPLLEQTLLLSYNWVKGVDTVGEKEPQIGATTSKHSDDSEKVPVDVRSKMLPKRLKQTAELKSTIIDKIDVFKDDELIMRNNMGAPEGSFEIRDVDSEDEVTLKVTLTLAIKPIIIEVLDDTEIAEKDSKEKEKREEEKQVAKEEEEGSRASEEEEVTKEEETEREKEAEESPEEEEELSVATKEEGKPEEKKVLPTQEVQDVEEATKEEEETEGIEKVGAEGEGDESEKDEREQEVEEKEFPTIGETVDKQESLEKEPSVIGEAYEEETDAGKSDMKETLEDETERAAPTTEISVPEERAEEYDGDTSKVEELDVVPEQTKSPVKEGETDKEEEGEEKEDAEIERKDEAEEQTEKVALIEDEEMLARDDRAEEDEAKAKESTEGLEVSPTQREASVKEGVIDMEKEKTDIEEMGHGISEGEVPSEQGEEDIEREQAEGEIKETASVLDVAPEETKTSVKEGEADKEKECIEKEEIKQKLEDEEAELEKDHAEGKHKAEDETETAASVTDEVALAKEDTAPEDATKEKEHADVLEAVPEQTEVPIKEGEVKEESLKESLVEEVPLKQNAELVDDKAEHDWQIADTGKDEIAEDKIGLEKIAAAEYEEAVATDKDAASETVPLEQLEVLESPEKDTEDSKTEEVLDEEILAKTGATPVATKASGLLDEKQDAEKDEIKPDILEQESYGKEEAAEEVKKLEEGRIEKVEDTAEIEKDTKDAEAGTIEEVPDEDILAKTGATPVATKASALLDEKEDAEKEEIKSDILVQESYGKEDAAKEVNKFKEEGMEKVAAQGEKDIEEALTAGEATDEENLAKVGAILSATKLSALGDEKQPIIAQEGMGGIDAGKEEVSAVKSTEKVDLPSTAISDKLEKASIAEGGIIESPPSEEITKEGIKTDEMQDDVFRPINVENTLEDVIEGITEEMEGAISVIAKSIDDFKGEASLEEGKKDKYVEGYTEIIEDRNELEPVNISLAQEDITVPHEDDDATYLSTVRETTVDQEHPVIIKRVILSYNKENIADEKSIDDEGTEVRSLGTEADANVKGDTTKDNKETALDDDKKGDSKSSPDIVTISPEQGEEEKEKVSKGFEEEAKKELGAKPETEEEEEGVHTTDTGYIEPKHEEGAEFKELEKETDNYSERIKEGPDYKSLMEVKKESSGRLSPKQTTEAALEESDKTKKTEEPKKEINEVTDETHLEEVPLNEVEPRKELKKHSGGHDSESEMEAIKEPEELSTKELEKGSVHSVGDKVDEEIRVQPTHTETPLVEVEDSKFPQQTTDGIAQSIVEEGLNDIVNIRKPEKEADSEPERKSDDLEKSPEKLLDEINNESHKEPEKDRAHSDEEIIDKVDETMEDVVPKPTQSVSPTEEVEDFKIRDSPKKTIEDENEVGEKSKDIVMLQKHIDATKLPEISDENIVKERVESRTDTKEETRPVKYEEPIKEDDIHNVTDLSEKYITSELKTKTKEASNVNLYDVDRGADNVPKPTQKTGKTIKESEEPQNELQQSLRNVVDWVNSVNTSQEEEPTQQDLLDVLTTAITLTSKLTNKKESEIMKLLLQQTIMIALNWIMSVDGGATVEDDMKQQLIESLTFASNWATSTEGVGEDVIIRQLLQQSISAALAWKKTTEK